MLGDHASGPVGTAALHRAHQRRLVVQHLHLPQQRGIARALADAEVEGAVEGVEGIEVALGEGRLLLGDQPFQHRGAARLARHGEADRHAFQGLAQLAEVADLGFRHADDAVEPAEALHQPVMQQALQGLPDRRAADAEALAQRHLLQLRAGGEAQRDDLRLHGGIEVGAARRAGVGQEGGHLVHARVSLDAPGLSMPKFAALWIKAPALPER